jgi:ribosomal protein S18 acetylase RimI-like enzyme
MDSVEIVHLQLDQWRQYRQIRLEALQNTPQAYSTKFLDMVDQPDSFWLDRLAKAAAKKDSWLLFAKADAKIVGIIGAHLPMNSQRAEIVSVYVTPDYRGKGVSTALMESILNELRQNDMIQRVELEVNQDQSTAVRLYKRFGFEITEEIEGEMGDGCVHIGYVMERKIWFEE